MSDHRRERSEERANRLGTTSLFQDAAIDKQGIQALASTVRVVAYDAGADIVREGEGGDCMYVLRSGAVEVRKRTRRGEVYTVEVLTAGASGFFGEIALIDRDTRSATVTCKTPCEVYTITREQFESLAERFPHLGLSVTREIARLLCARLRRANEDIVTLFGALVDEIAESGGVAEQS